MCDSRSCRTHAQPDAGARLQAGEFGRLGFAAIERRDEAQARRCTATVPREVVYRLGSGSGLGIRRLLRGRVATLGKRRLPGLVVRSGLVGCSGFTLQSRPVAVLGAPHQRRMREQRWQGIMPAAASASPVGCRRVSMRTDRTGADRRPMWEANAPAASVCALPTVRPAPRTGTRAARRRRPGPSSSA